MTVLPYSQDQGSKKEQVASMFNSISRRYDFLNHFLSLGIDHYWRRRAIAQLKALKPKMILDIATGTGDLAVAALRLNPTQVIGVDISEGMLDFGKEKIKKRGLSDKIQLQVGDSENLQFEDNNFDALTVAFGVRNFENLEKGLSEMFRVLRPGGKAVILEFSKPRHFPIKQLYNFYFRYILPKIGKLVSKDSSAYTYLPDSVNSFPDGDRFVTILDHTGFKNTRCITLTFGICALYIGTK